MNLVELRKAAATLSWLAVQFRDRANDDGEPTSIQDAEQVEAAGRAYAGLLEMLDNVSASLRTVVAAHGASMAKADRDSRGALAEAARLVCDALLREEPDWIALAHDAGYDGSPGGEREWCIDNGMTSKVEE